MNKDKEVDIRCMSLGYATQQCPGMHPDVVLEIAQKYVKFVLGSKADLRIVSNDDKGAA